MAGALEVQERLLRLLRARGRRVYTFSMGKLNAPKLGNFLRVEAYCLLSCSLSSLVDAARSPLAAAAAVDDPDADPFHVQVLTPLELFLSCLTEHSRYRLYEYVKIPRIGVLQLDSVPYRLYCIVTEKSFTRTVSDSAAELLFACGGGTRDAAGAESKAFFYTTELEELLPGGALYARLDEELSLGALMSAPLAPVAAVASATDALSSSQSGASASASACADERVTWRGLASTSDRDELAASSCECGRVPCVCLRAGLQGVASAYATEPHWSSRSALTSKRSSVRSSMSDLT